MWYMIRAISLRRMLEHKLRTTLTILGIALGVAGFIAVQMITATLSDSFSRMIDQVAGRVQLQITSGETGVEESVLKQIQGQPDLYAALPVIQAVTRSESGQTMLVLAVDTLNDKVARDYKMKDKTGAEISDPLLFLNARNAILLSRDFAQRYHIKIDEPLTLVTSQGKTTFMVRGLLEPQGAAEAFGGNFALMDIYAAQLLFGREGKFDSIDLMLKPGVDIEAVREKISRLLGGKYEVMHPQERSSGVENMMLSFHLGLALLAVIVLAMGIFIIINTVMTTVLQRKREIGMQRMVGVTRWGLWGLFSLEGVLFGFAGSVVGIAAGYFMGREAVLYFASSVSSMFVIVDLSRVSFHWDLALEGVMLGVLVSLGASLYPAWRATRITPLEVVGSDYSLSKGKGIALRRWLIVLVPALSAVVYLTFAPFGFQLNGTRLLLIALFLTFISVTPFVMYVLLRIARLLVGGQSSVLARLAAENILRDLGRAAMTVAAFMVGLAVMIEIYLFVTGSKTQIVDWINDALKADLLVTSSTNIASRDAIPIAPELGDELLKVPGVRAVTAFRLMMTDYNHNRIALASMDFDKNMNDDRLQFVEGDRATALRRLKANEAVVVTQNLVLRQNLKGATKITLDTPEGKRDFPIAGVVMDYASEQGVVHLNRSLYVQVFKDPMVTDFEVFLKPGYALTAVRDAIFQNEKVKQHFGLYVLTNREFKGLILTAIDQLFALAYSLEVLAMIIAFMGIINNLLATVVDRTREIAVIRSIGATRSQVARIFLFQAGLLAISGTLISVVAGFSLGKVQLGRVTLLFVGWAMPLTFSWSHLLPLLGAAIFVGLLAGVIPARVAARLTLHDALKYE